jgi:CubicO group peptidase (beta-lactamase class C family)
MNSQINIDGTVAPGFESVKTLYERNMHALAERNTQLCIYHRGQKVVDLWGSAVGETDFSPDSLVNVFSSGKSLETMAMASLVSAGLLDYSARVTEYWPEFAGNGKEATTVADLLRHEGGMAALDVSIDPADLLTENIKKNSVGQIIEAHDQKFKPNGGRREYHAVSRGWLLNEVFRRVDPAGRTMGEYFRQDISAPLEADVIIGVTDAEMRRRWPVIPLSPGFQLIESLKPGLRNRRMERNIFQLGHALFGLLPVLRNRSRRKPAVPFTGMQGIAAFNDPAIAMGETPSAAASCSARGLAKVAAMMAMGGTWRDQKFLSDQAWKALHDEPVVDDMGFVTPYFTQGGLAALGRLPNRPTSRDLGLNQGREGFYGWMGLGGSIIQWHPEHQVGFAYVPTSLNVLDLVNERGKSYQSEVLNILR